MSEVFLSVVVPSYNEMKNVERGVLDEILGYLRKQTYTWEVIFSDDGSTDGTADAIEEWIKQQKTKGLAVVHNEHAGKAQTIISGMKEATGEWRLFVDFDQSTPLEEIEKLWKYKDDGYGIIFGSREGEGAKREKEPVMRHIMGRGFNWLVQILAVPGVRDTQCGFKMFLGTTIDYLLPQLKIYTQEKNIKKDAFTGALDVELLLLARKKHIPFKEVEIVWHHHATDRVAPIKDSWRMLVDIIRIRLAHW
ncbi:glycosyltransferase [Microgenomates group bacterium]|nr:glycosyltransferase [Microgenomates group bacterium]